MTRSSALVAFGAAAVGLVLGSSPVSAQNLVVNPSFNTDVAGWNVLVGAAFTGAQGSPAPGSVLFGGFNSGGTDFDVVDQCVPGIVAGTSYNFGANVRLAVVPAGSVGRIMVTWASDSSCATLLSFQSAPLVTTVGSFQSTSSSAVAPAGAVAAQISGHYVGGASTGDVEVLFDEFFLQTSASVPTMNGWWVSILGIALAGIAALRRLRSV